MKKLLSLIAAGAMALGLIGCSGDLHDVSLIDLTGYGLRGTLTGWDANDDVPLVDNNDGTYSYTFTSTDETTSFAILEIGDATWGTAYRLAQPKADGDTANVFSTEGDGKSGQKGMEQKVYLGQSADCMSIPDTKGKSVTITVTPDSTFLLVKVEVTGGDVPAAPQPYYLDGYFVRGDMNGWGATVDTLIYGAEVQKTTGNIVYTYDFTVSGISEAGFGIATKDWSKKYTGGTFAVGTDTDYVATEVGADANNKITGLKDGSSYRLFIQTTPDEEVSFKVTEICAYKLVFVIENLDEECTAAWLNGGFWGAWDTGWPMEAWGGVKTDYAISDAVTIVDGTADFTGSKFDVTGVAEPGETLSKEVKFVATKDNWETTAYDNDNISVEVEIESAGTYKVVINAEDNEVTSVTKL